MSPKELCRSIARDIALGSKGINFANHYENLLTRFSAATDIQKKQKWYRKAAAILDQVDALSWCRSTNSEGHHYHSTFADIPKKIRFVQGGAVDSNRRRH